jgi:hypothetical protein
LPSTTFDFSGFVAGSAAGAGSDGGFAAFGLAGGGIASEPSFLLGAGLALVAGADAGTFAAGATDLDAGNFVAGVFATGSFAAGVFAAGVFATGTFAATALDGGALDGGALDGGALDGAALDAGGLIEAFFGAGLTGFGACLAFTGLAFGNGLAGFAGFLGATFFTTELTAFAGFLRAGELWEGLPRSVRFAPAMGETTLPKALR